MPRWDPFREFARMERDMRNMFDDFWGGRARQEALPGPGKVQLPARRDEALVGTPTVDIVDKKDKLVLRSEMPGAKKDNIKISIEEDRIHLSGKIEREKEEKKEDYYYSERAYSAWERTIPLPVKIKPDDVKATYKNGVLEVTLPKAEEAKAKVKDIKIE